MAVKLQPSECWIIIFFVAISANIKLCPGFLSGFVYCWQLTWPKSWWNEVMNSVITPHDTTHRSPLHFKVLTMVYSTVVRFPLTTTKYEWLHHLWSLWTGSGLCTSRCDHRRLLKLFTQSLESWAPIPVLYTIKKCFSVWSFQPFSGLVTFWYTLLLLIKLRIKALSLTMITSVYVGRSEKV